MSLSLSQFLKQKVNKKDLQKNHKRNSGDDIKKLQSKMLSVQQGIWHQKQRAIFVFEGFDAAGKGGTIRIVTERLDPRGVRVHAIAEPSREEQAKHYLYRFWKDLPAPGTICIFDRSWYGRVLIEKVDKLTPKKRLEQAYKEINQFEEMLTNDGVRVFKFFLAISKKEQLKRYHDRMNDPTKRWKLTESDIRARKEWDKYVKCVDRIFKETSTKESPWHLIAADDKEEAHIQVLKILLKELEQYEKWIHSSESRKFQKNMEHQLKKLK